MIEGNPQRFAIECEIDERVDEWVLGHLRFWLCGHALGNWHDSVDLRGCHRWLRDFESVPRIRFEPGLFALSAKEVFARIYDPVMNRDPRLPAIADAYDRFHISHVGMSAFDRYDILLLTDEQGAERCLWRESGSDHLHECFLRRREMERIAGQFCALLEREEWW